MLYRYKKVGLLSISGQKHPRKTQVPRPFIDGKQERRPSAKNTGDEGLLGAFYVFLGGLNMGQKSGLRHKKSEI